MNWLDAFIILIFILFVYADFRRGFLRLMCDLIGMALGFAVAIISYKEVALLISAKFQIELNVANSISFLVIWLVTQTFFYILSRIISHYTPRKIKDSKTNRYLAILPALIKGFIFLIFIIILLLTLPMSDASKKILNGSIVSSFSMKYALLSETKLEQVFGTPILAMAKINSLTLGAPDETTILDFSTNSMTIDSVAEKTILDKINLERQKAGEGTLTEDLLIRNVARAHSRDMLANGYFYHTSKTGLTLFDRFVRANVNFHAAAENIALAPTADLAHTGLMNSPKHKANILDPAFTTIGIGVMSSSYGLMVTENFAN